MSRPQSALITSPRLLHKASVDNYSDTSSSVNIFKVTVKTGTKLKKQPISHQPPHWSSDTSSDASLGEKIEALARKNTVQFVEGLEEEVEEVTNPGPSGNTCHNKSSKDDLAFCASFLPPRSSMAISHQNNAMRRKSDSVLAFSRTQDLETRHMSSRVQEWIDEIQALDEEEGRLELKEAEAADALAEMSLEEEVFTSKRKAGDHEVVEACAGGTDESFEDDLDELQDLIDR